MSGRDYDDDAAARHYADPENRQPVGPGRRPRRPARTLGKHASVRFPADLISEIKQLADQDHMTISTWIRGIVTQEVKRRRHPKQLCCDHMTVSGIQSASCPDCGPLVPAPITTTGGGILVFHNPDSQAS